MNTQSAPKQFSINAHGVAQFMSSSPYAQRGIVESYAFPDEDKAKIITPVPAKGIVYDYFSSNRDPRVLADAIAKYGRVPTVETSFARGRRRSALSVAKHLEQFGPKLAFNKISKQTYSGDMDGLKVRTSLDFTCEDRRGKRLGIIANVSEDTSDREESIKAQALVECEITWQLSRGAARALDEVWYIDIPGEKIIRRHVRNAPSAWRNIRTVCDNIVIAYDTLIARRRNP